MTSRAIALLFFVLSVSVSVSVASGGAARADTPGDASALYDQGVAAYSAHDYEGAVTFFKDAYALDPRPEILFAWAQAERLSGDCTSAISLYRKFLDGHPSAVQAQAAQVPLQKCERSLESKPDVPPAQAATPPETPAPAPALPGAAVPAPEPSPSPPERRHFYQDALGDVLVGAGVAAAAVGVGLLVTGGSPDGASSWGEFQSRRDSAISRRRTGGIVLGAGAALVAAGVTKWIIWAGGGDAGVAAVGTF